MKNSYDTNNIFAKILSQKSLIIKFRKRFALAFSDINPQAPIHILIIPKNAYINFYDFTKNASRIETELFWKLVNDTIEHTKVYNEGFRIITNSGDNGNQDVPHFHVHLLGERI